MVTRYCTRCWQLVVFPLPLFPSSMMDWSWRVVRSLRYAAWATPYIWGAVSSFRQPLNMCITWEQTKQQVYSFLSVAHFWSHPNITYRDSHLLRVHGRHTDRVDDHYVWPSVGVDEVSSVALSQCVHDAGLVQVEQRRQILHTVQRGRVRLNRQMKHPSIPITDK